MVQEEVSKKGHPSARGPRRGLIGPRLVAQEDRTRCIVVRNEAIFPCPGSLSCLCVGLAAVSVSAALYGSTLPEREG